MGLLGIPCLCLSHVKAKKPGGNEAISCLWSWYLFQILLCVESQWVLIKLRVRTVTSGTPWLSTWIGNNLLSNHFHGDNTKKCTCCYGTHLFPMDLVIKDPLGMWRGEPKETICLNKRHKTMSWGCCGETDMVVCQCTDLRMSRYVTETMAGNMGEMNCVIKQGQGIVLPLCFQTFSFCLFIFCVIE